MKAVTFYNFTDTSFTHTWNSEQITVRAGESRMMEDWLAEHMAKHLTDKILNERGVRTDDPSRAGILAQILPVDGLSVEADTKIKFQEAMVNSKPIEQKVEVEAEPKAPWCDSCDSKGMRHKKDCPKAVKKEEFAGL